MVPMAPLTRPISVHRLDDSMTRALTAKHMIASSPEASSDEALDAFGPVWRALIVAIGCPQVCSFETLCSTTASTVGNR